MFAAFRSRPAFSAAEAIAEAEAGRMIVIDVRGHDEVARSGKAKGAVHIPLMLLEARADPRHPECLEVMKEGRPIGVYCASGNRSGMAVQALQRLGHQNVQNIGGLSDWLAAGGALD